MSAQIKYVIVPHLIYYHTKYVLLAVCDTKEQAQDIINTTNLGPYSDFNILEVPYHEWRG